ncbi:MAG TPA: glycosyltransferase family 4 protein [Gammaproteobacteria bacterium]|nr:glycosyltransferase family 4 protein [Gammaproteobacteria bacterium]
MNSHWLFVSKPLSTPLTDGTQVLVSHLVRHLEDRFRVSYFGEPERPLRAGLCGEALRARHMGHAPPLFAKLQMLATLVKPRYRRTPLHFFFTPNAATSRIVALLKRIAPRRPIVQSLMSSHDAARHAHLLRSLDAVVVLSRHTRDRLVAAGLPSSRVHCIYPAVDEVSIREPRLPSWRVLYAGDLDERVVDRLVRVMRAIESSPGPWTLTIACRPKAPRDAEQRRRLEALLAQQIAAGRAEVRGEIGDMRALLRDTALQIFVADHVVRKVDLPLVLLEGLAAGVPLVALDFPPLNEVFALAREHDLTVGRLVALDDDGSALESTVRAVLSERGFLVRAGKHARTLVRLEFSLPAMVRRYGALYDTLEKENGSD